MRPSDAGAATAGWGASGRKEALTVATVMKAFAAEQFIRSNGPFSFVGVVSNDSATWLDLRTHAVAAVLAAKALGGSGTASIAGWTDGAPERSFIASTDTGEFVATTGANTREVEAKVHAIVEPIVEVKLDAERSKVPVVLALPPEVAALHAEVLGALRRTPADDVMRVVSGWTDSWPSPGKAAAFVPLATSFPTAPALLDAFAAGWKNLYTPNEVPAAALLLLAALDRPLAQSFASRALALAPARPLRTAAHATFFDLSTDAGVVHALDTMRDVLVPTENHNMVEDRIWRALKDAGERARPLVRARFEAVVGGSTAGAPYRTLDDRDAAYAISLGWLVRDIGTPDDLDVVVPLWCGLGDRRLTSFSVAASRGGALAKRLLAEQVGIRRPHIDFFHEAQSAGVAALAESDVEQLFKRVGAVIDEPEPTPEQVSALESFVRHVERTPSARDTGWLDRVRRIAARFPGSPLAKTADDCLRKSATAQPGVEPTAPRVHVIEVSPSGRAGCRGCKAKIPKGELRFGEAMENVFSGSGDATHRWYHLSCAAEKKPALLGPLLEAFAGDVPDRAALAATILERSSKKKAKR